eukprot:gene1614-4750_t
MDSQGSHQVSNKQGAQKLNDEQRNGVNQDVKCNELDKKIVEVHQSQKKGSIEKRKRAALSAETQLHIIESVRSGRQRASRLAKEHGVSRAYISKLVKNGRLLDKLKQAKKYGINMGSPFVYITPRSVIEGDLLAYIHEMSNRNSNQRKPLTPHMLFLKAREFRDLRLSAMPEGKEKKALESVTISQSWISKFIRRNEIRLTKSANAGSISNSISDRYKTAITELHTVTSRYSPENIYNVDDMCLVYRAIPKYTADTLSKDGDCSHIRGAIQDEKDSITVIIAVNATGSHKIPLAVVGSSENPTCFRRESLPLQYFWQYRSWVTKSIMSTWLNTTFCTAVRSRTSNKVLLLMDYCPSNVGITIDDPDIEVHFLPKQSSIIRPAHMGLFSLLRRRYRKEVLKQTVEIILKKDEFAERRRGVITGYRGLMHGCRPNLLDAINILTSEWEKTTKEAIVSCWIKAGCLADIHACKLNIIEKNKKSLAEFEFKTANMIDDMVNELDKLKGKIHEAKQILEEGHQASETDLLRNNVIAVAPVCDGAVLADVLMDWVTLEEHQIEGYEKGGTEFNAGETIAEEDDQEKRGQERLSLESNAACAMNVDRDHDDVGVIEDEQQQQHTNQEHEVTVQIPQPTFLDALRQFRSSMISFIHQCYLADYPDVATATLKLDNVVGNVLDTLLQKE